MTEKTKIVKSETDEEKIAHLAKFSGYTTEQIAIIKNTVAKNTTNTELAYFFSVCKVADLNPFLKEAWCYKDNKGNLLVFAGRDGFLKIAQRDKRWNGMLSAYVCENDKFELDIPNGKVKHIITGKDRGSKILGAYAIIKPKGCDYPTVEWVDFDTYNKGYNVWGTNPGLMIQKTAETHCLKKAHGIMGLQPEYDFEIVNNQAIPIEDVSQVNELEEAKTKIVDGLALYKGEDKQEIQDMCVAKANTGEFDMGFAKETAKTIGVEL